jgi:DNA helicase-2/ATP-dependent DNA helicase PcrA
MKAAIPYRVYGGLRFFERAEIKHALAYLRLLENRRDDTSLLRVINFPPRGIGSRSIELLQDTAKAQGMALVEAAAHLSGRAGSAIRAFIAKLDVMRETSINQTLRDIIAMVLDQSGLLAHYRADREGADRVENLEELLSAAESFVMQEGFGRDALALPLDETEPDPQQRRVLRQPLLTPSPASQGLNVNATDSALEMGQTGDLWAALPPIVDAVSVSNSIAPFPDETGETLSPLVAFLTFAALEAGDNQAQAGQDAVQLMTVHAAKGLEFDHVFITGLEEGLFPHENSASERAGLEEERRLMYVAITRARRRLYLSHAAMRMLHGQTRYNLPSRFLDELPAKSLRWLTPKAAKPPAFSTSSAPSSRYAGIGTPIAFPSPTLTPTPTPAPASASGGMRVGQRVFHQKFGEGQVLMLEGSGSEARVQIQFLRHGTKWLILSLAKLTFI